jgi:protein-tyrosine phosphatase
MTDVTHLLGDLWIGSAPSGSGGRQQFDVIFLCAEEWQPSSREFPGVSVRRCPFDDPAGAASAKDIDMALTAAAQAAEDLVAGRRVLITCMMGRNRSALVSALTLHMLLGESAVRMGKLVQSRRIDPTGVPALSNPSMWAVLEEVDAVTPR